jgi:hypothetical protein
MKVLHLALFQLNVMQAQPDIKGRTLRDAPNI